MMNAVNNNNSRTNLSSVSATSYVHSCVGVYPDDASDRFQ